jgi:hypothetical protein
MRLIILACVLSLAASFEVRATSSFGYAGEPFSIQLVGRDFSPNFHGAAEVAMPAGPKSLPRQAYSIRSYIYGTFLELKFENRSDPNLPPSFILTVSGNAATLVVEDRTYRGCFGWQDDHSDCPLNP